MKIGTASHSTHARWAWATGAAQGMWGGRRGRDGGGPGRRARQRRPEAAGGHLRRRARRRGRRRCIGAPRQGPYQRRTSISALALVQAGGWSAAAWARIPRHPRILHAVRPRRCRLPSALNGNRPRRSRDRPADRHRRPDRMTRVGEVRDEGDDFIFSQQRRKRWLRNRVRTLFQIHNHCLQKACRLLNTPQRHL